MTLQRNAAQELVVVICSAQNYLILWKNRNIPIMKRELALAILVIAGVLLANYHRFNPWRPSDLPDGSASTGRGHAALIEAAEQPNEFRLTSQVAESPSDNHAPQELLDAIASLRQAPPLRAELEVRVDHFDEPIILRGTYRQAGEGAPKSRLDIGAEAGSPPLVTQVFDGRFYYLLETRGGAQKLTYIDQLGVASLSTPRVASVAGLRGWFGTGSWPVMLEHLACSFQFATPSESSASSSSENQTRQVTLVGSWRPESLLQLLREQIDPAWIAGDIQWERLPQQIPHEIEITLNSGASHPTFPSRLSIYQYRRAGKRRPRIRTLVASIQVTQLTIEQCIDPAVFQVSAEGVISNDATNDYLNRIKAFLFHPLMR